MTIGELDLKQKSCGDLSSHCGHNLTERGCEGCEDLICSVIISFEDLPIEIPEPGSGHGGDGAELRLLVLSGHEGLGRPAAAGGDPLRPSLGAKLARRQQAR